MCTKEDSGFLEVDTKRAGYTRKREQKGQVISAGRHREDVPHDCGRTTGDNPEVSMPGT